MEVTWTNWMWQAVPRCMRQLGTVTLLVWSIWYSKVRTSGWSPKRATLPWMWQNPMHSRKWQSTCQTVVSYESDVKGALLIIVNHYLHYSLSSSPLSSSTAPPLLLLFCSNSLAMMPISQPLVVAIFLAKNVCMLYPSSTVPCRWLFHEKKTRDYAHYLEQPWMNCVKVVRTQSGDAQLDAISLYVNLCWIMSWHFHLQIEKSLLGKWCEWSSLQGKGELQWFSSHKI